MPTRPDRESEVGSRSTVGMVARADGGEDRPEAIVRQLDRTERGVGSQSAVGVVARAMGMSSLPGHAQDWLDDGGVDGVVATGMSS